MRASLRVPCLGFKGNQNGSCPFFLATHATAKRWDFAGGVILAATDVNWEGQVGKPGFVGSLGELVSEHPAIW